MKQKIFQILYTLFFLTLGINTVPAQQNIQGKIAPRILQDTLYLLHNYDSIAPDINNYTRKGIEYQKKNNNKESLLLTYAPFADSLKTFPDNLSLPFEKRNIDFEEITPFTWKWVQFELTEADGSITQIGLLRPNWWILYHKADKIGNIVSLSMPEAGISGNAVVTKLKPNFFDTRFYKQQYKTPKTYRPATGWFIHQSSDTWDYYFEGEPEAIGATSLHPFYSLDRQTYIPAGKLKIGERVKTRKGTITKLIEKEKRSGTEPVYNLEIYRDHNFYVGEQGLLVHNSYIVNTYVKKLGLNLSDEIIARVDNIIKTNHWKNIPNELTVFDNSGSLVKRNKTELFIEDAAKKGNEFLKIFEDNPHLINSWDIISSSSFRTNKAYLQKIDDFVNKPYTPTGDILESEKVKRSFIEACKENRGKQYIKGDAEILPEKLIKSDNIFAGITYFYGIPDIDAVINFKNSIINSGELVLPTLKKVNDEYVRVENGDLIIKNIDKDKVEKILLGYSGVMSTGGEVAFEITADIDYLKTLTGITSEYDIQRRLAFVLREHYGANPKLQAVGQKAASHRRLQENIFNVKERLLDYPVENALKERFLWGFAFNPKSINGIKQIELGFASGQVNRARGNGFSTTMDSHNRILIRTDQKKLVEYLKSIDVFKNCKFTYRKGFY